jgi:hypothetical protein
MAVAVALIGLAVFGTTRLGLAVAVGWLAHLVADAPTYKGLPLLWPLSNRMMHLTPGVLRWQSGTGWIEWPLALACLWLATKGW